MTPSPIIVWFRRALRLADHPALEAAAERPVIPVYILDDEAAGELRLGGASRWWLAQSLKALSAGIERRGGALILRAGHPLTVLPQLARETGAEAVYFTRGYEPFMPPLEAALKAALETDGIRCRRFAGQLLFEPEEIRNKSGAPFKVFTPYYKACLALGAPRKPRPAPSKLAAPRQPPKSEALSDWGLEPSKPDWAGGMREEWTPGEEGAARRLDAFIKNVAANYGETRNLPERNGTSKLSPHLAFGEISPHQIWGAVSEAASARPGLQNGAGAYLREIIWREFSYHLLFHNPALREEPFRPDFAAFPWRKDDAALKAWRRGATGYPIVDAGLRELWHTGWMHNRVRMIAASFLIKHLLIDWRGGEAWFWDTLVDADPANNAASWQWVAGSGADAAPYFRIFNPVLQGEKFDAEGGYVRRWVPELAKLPAAHIHAPWSAPAKILDHAGVKLGTDYPHPIVEHAAARERALAAFQTLKR